MATDRTLYKQMQAGAANSVVSANNAVAAIAAVHSRVLSAYKHGTENAATNVAEVGLAWSPRKAVVNYVKYLTGTNVANDSTDYAVITVAKRTAGGAATTVATYNTHTSAQGAITQWAPAAFSVVSNSDATLAAGDALTYKVLKYGSGKVIDVGHIVADVEEV
jgi:hypothetical protein